MIKQAFLTQVEDLGASPALANQFWQQIEDSYTAPGRCFHDLSHLEFLYCELQPLPLEDWPTILFSIVYHDVVYDVEQHMVLHDNEERCADLAEQNLKRIHYPPDKIERCRRQIMATKNHLATPDPDTSFFTDADLSILGQSWRVYNDYRKKIRLEYAVYPDSVFNAGRRKVLLNFQQMEPLFKTSYFRNLYEERAKANLSREIDLLQPL